MIGSNVVFLMGVGMLMVTRWFTGPAPGGRDRQSATLVRAFAWFLTALGFVIGTIMIVPGLVILWFASLAVIISMAYSKQVATQQYALLALVGVAADRSIPLETAFAAFGHERGGWMRQRTAEIAHMLNHGAPLPAALKAVPGALPPEAVPLVCVGHENGSLGPAIAQAITARNLFEPVWQSIVPKIGYICILPAVAVGTVAFLFIWIIPQFEKIFKDFNTRLPDVTLALFRASRWDVRVAAARRFLAVNGGAARLWPAALRGLDPLGPAGHGLALAAAAHCHGARRPCPGRPAAAALGRGPFDLGSLFIRNGRSSAACGPPTTTCRPAATTCNACIATACSARRTWPCCNRPGETATSPGPRGKWPTATAAASSTASMPLLQVIFPLVIVGYGLLVAGDRGRSVPPLVNLILN